MSNTKPAASLDRRGFLKGIGTGAAGAATVVAGAATPTTATAAESAADKKKTRYRESEHVKRFYQTNRY